MTTTEHRPAPAGAAFPPGFAWGVATAAYQIEGSVAQDGRGPSIWDTFSRTPGRTANGDTGDVAVDHYRRYREDVALMADLGVGAYRFSVAWPRIVPEGTGRVEQRGLDFYQRLVDELLGKGIEPWLTLYHWDLPQPLQDRGGWTARETAAAFADYAGIVQEALGDRVRHWSTLNEPWCSSLLSYAAGQHAPGVTDPAQAARAVHHLLLGHGMAVQALRAGGAQDVGITLNLAPISPATDSPADVDAARRIDGQQNRLFLDPVLRGAYPGDVAADLERAGAPLPVQDGDLAVIGAPVDWLGINYYMSHVVRASTPEPGRRGPAAHHTHTPFIGCDDVETLPPTGPTTDMGWGVNAGGLEQLLVELAAAHPSVPLVITENGSAYPDQVSPDGQVHDADRVAYLHQHLDACAAALARGVDLRGYFAWSLMDNFEWAQGYDKRFGIVRVDYDTQRRTLKDSARAYAAFIAEQRGHAGSEQASGQG